MKRNSVVALLAGAALLLGASPAGAAPLEAGPATPLVALNYRIAIVTSDVEDGGTDSTVKIQLCGTRGCTPTPEQPIEDPNWDDRERGNTDVHNREWSNVGTLTHLRLRQEDDGSWWHLHSIEVIYDGKRAVFSFHDWVDRETWEIIYAA